MNYSNSDVRMRGSVEIPQDRYLRLRELEQQIRDERIERRNRKRRERRKAAAAVS